MIHAKMACTALADRKWAWIVAEVRRLLVVKGKACTRIAINKSGKQL